MTTDQPKPAVLLEVTDNIATITLNRAEQHNAFTDQMETELITAFDATDADDAVRVVILTGAGRSFCAGMDLSAGADTFRQWRGSTSAPAGSQIPQSDPELPVRRDGGGRVALRMFDSDKPIIAAINGAAVGVGATLLLAADLRLAGESARFGFVFTRRGVVPESCSSWFLPRLVPLQIALEWVLTGRIFGAAEAQRHGLVRSVHPDQELLDAATALAREIAENTAPVSVALARQMLLRLQAAPHPMAAHYVETLALNQRGLSRDAEEGFSSFLQKRQAEFPDRVSTDLPDVFGPFPAPDFDPKLVSENL